MAANMVQYHIETFPGVWVNEGFILRNFYVLYLKECNSVFIFLLRIPKPVNLYIKKTAFIEKLNGKKIGWEFTSGEFTWGKFLGGIHRGGDLLDTNTIARSFHAHWWRHHMIQYNYWNSNFNSSYFNGSPLSSIKERLQKN